MPKNSELTIPELRAKRRNLFEIYRWTPYKERIKRHQLMSEIKNIDRLIIEKESEIIDNADSD